MFTHTNVYIPYFLRSTPRYLKTFEKMGLRDLHLACVDFWPILETRRGGGDYTVYTFKCVHPCKDSIKLFSYMKCQSCIFFHI